MLQLHLSDQQFYYLLRCTLYQRFGSTYKMVMACQGAVLKQIQHQPHKRPVPYLTLMRSYDMPFERKVIMFNCILYLHIRGCRLAQFSNYCKLNHWGWVTHICVRILTIIGSDNGLSPGRCQAIIWTNAGILLIGPLGTNTNFSEILIEILTIWFKKMHLKWRPFCLSLNVLTHKQWEVHGCVLNIVITDALVLKLQDISINSQDLLFIALDQCHTNKKIHNKYQQDIFLKKKNNLVVGSIWGLYCLHSGQKKS